MTCKVDDERRDTFNPPRPADHCPLGTIEAGARHVPGQCAWRISRRLGSLGWKLKMGLARALGANFLIWGAFPLFQVLASPCRRGRRRPSSPLSLGIVICSAAQASKITAFVCDADAHGNSG